jgi:uncharacterized protein (TIGR03437 family)
LADAIKAANDPDVTAEIGAAFTRVIVVARNSGAAGTGISVAGSTNAGASMTVTAYTSATCCNVAQGSPITPDNPAFPGERIVLSAAGLGSLGLGANEPVAGVPFNGPVPNTATNSVSATMGGSTAQIVAAGMDRGSYGKYSVDMIVPSNLAANAATQVYIAQNAFVSNIVTVPIGSGTGNGSTTTGPPPCTYSLSHTSRTYMSGATSGIIGVTTQAGCAWTASVDQNWVSFTKSTSLNGSDSITYSIAANTSGATRTATLTIAGQSVTITQSGSATPNLSGLQFVPLATPCRAVDTRTGPAIAGGSTRDFAIASACGIPGAAQAFAMNATVVPINNLSYLQLWAAGGTQPATSILNSYDGRIKANASIVPAGSNGAVTAYATDDTHLILDVSGYYVPAGTTGALAFYSVAPCRVLDTRLAAGPLGGPMLTAGQARGFPVPASACGIPANARAYSFNVTAIPQAPLLYLAVWPAGQAQPATSTLNAPTGTVVANAATVVGGTGGAIGAYATANTHLVIDINGYYAPPGGTGGLNLYVPAPCRALDTRFESTFAPVNGTLSNIDLTASGCGVPSGAQSYVFNATVVPVSTLSWLTLWQGGNSPPPFVSTLNSFDGAITSNLAVVPAGGNAINAFTTDPAYLILDLYGYFAP